MFKPKTFIMVRVIDYKARTSQEGKVFFSLILQGGMEVVKSASGNAYLTAKKATIPTTFDEQTCLSLVGSELPGTIEKVPCDPYQYVIPETGEVVMLNHRYEYSEEENKVTDFTKVYQPSSNGIHKPQAA